MLSWLATVVASAKECNVAFARLALALQKVQQVANAEDKTIQQKANIQLVHYNVFSLSHPRPRPLPPNTSRRKKGFQQKLVWSGCQVVVRQKYLLVLHYIFGEYAVKNRLSASEQTITQIRV